MEKTKSRFLIVGIVITLIVAVIGSSYAYWKGVIQGRGSDILVKLGQAEVILTDDMVLGDNKVRPGWSISKTFTVENQSGAVFKYDIYIRDLINTLVTDGFLQYKITSSDGGYNMEEFAPIAKSPTPSDFDLATNISIEASARHTYTIEFRYVDSPDVNQSEDMGKSFSGNLMIRENTSKTLYTILTDGVEYSDVKTRTTGDFDSALGGTSIDSSYDTTGVIYKESERKENGRDVYYFAGNPQDNWVKFAGFYWRIIRTNEDGSVRLLYAGTSPDTQTGYINNTTYTYSINSSTYDNTMYVGWKYGTSGSLANNRGYSNQGAAKAALDSWYSTNITGSNANMVSTDAIYCNDRAGDGWRDSGQMYYAASNRLYNKNTAGRQPSYKCGENTTGTYYTSSGSWSTKTKGMYSDASSIDKFSKTTGAGGNGQLTYPVGLMTADEVAFAGGRYGLNAPNTYYYRNSRTGCTGANGDPCSVTGTTYWWTMSPYNANSGSSAFVFAVIGSTHLGSLGNSGVHNTNGAVRPVLSLKNEVTVISGDGTADNPFEVDLTTSGSNTKYNVTLKAENANIDGENVTTKTKEVVENGSVIFNVVANDTYELGSVSCDNGAIGFVENGKVVINDVKRDNVCEVTVTKKRYLVNVTSNNNSYGTVSPTSQSVEHGSSVTITLSPKTDYKYSSNTCGGTVNGSTMTISNVTAAKTCTVTFVTTKKTLYAQLTDGVYYSNVKTRSAGTFDAILGDSTATTKTIYRENTYRETSGNNNKNVYYFAGNVADNWVSFAGYMWRIIRTNEDGGVRLLYHGTSTTATDAYIATGTKYNRLYDNTRYVGYMYGTTGSIANNRTNGTSSTIKTVVDNWYRDNINASYNGYVSETAIYCNDRASGAYASSGGMYYASYYRLLHVSRQPSYQCGQNSAGGYYDTSVSWVSSTAAYTSAAPDVADKFSKSTASGGNGKLTYPIGLMTADEVAFAGGLYNTNSPNTYYYLNSVGGSSTGSNYYWWTMSPFNVQHNSFPYMFAVYHSSALPGCLYYYNVDDSRGAVRPVLSLKSCVTVSEGDGTASNPYKVELPSTCATAAN